MNQIKLKEFLNFDKMITPKIIIYIFVIDSALLFLMSFLIFVSGISNGTFLTIFLGLLLMVLTPFINRIICENILILFKIFEKLKDIDEKLSKNIWSIIADTKL